MVPLQISLFGKFCAHCGDKAIEDLDAYKVKELFSYLLLHAGQPQHREKLAGLLWDKQSSTQSKNYLRRTLWQLQNALTIHEGSDSYFQIDSEWVQIKYTGNLWSDVAIFELAFQKANGKLGSALDETAVKGLVEAVQMYRGDLLEGWYQDWCLFERERFRQMLLMMLDKLMVYYESVGAYEIAMTHGVQILRHDLARERTHRKLMRLHFLIGDRTGAIRQYKRCKNILNEELGVAPAQRTEQLHAQIEADLIPPQNLDFSASENNTTYLKNTLRRLHRFDNILNKTHQEIQQEIQRIESSLSGSEK